KKALTLEPESGHIIDSLGWLYFKKGDFINAITQLERAMIYLPNDSTVAEHLGDAYLSVSLKDKAVAAYEKATTISPSNEPLKEKLDKLRQELKK
ncbi:MAG: hypothetical protein AAB065_05725, partial [Deltaproteobacteria bacterium]